MSNVIITGHKNPDTDSIVSAIVAQEYFAKALGVDAQACRSGEMNNESKFILDTFGVQKPLLVSEAGEISSVALVDHNQKAQVFDAIDYNLVDYIIDHHNISIQTEKPIFCRVETTGSTSSLLAKMFAEKNIEPSKTAASLMLAGILSDTLNLTSPTTTPEDKALTASLSKIAEIDVQSFVAQMFQAKSSLEGISIEEIISLDYKNFEMGTHAVGVGTWETTFPKSVHEKQAEIFAALQAKKIKEGLDYLFFMVVDILGQYCDLYLIGDPEKELAQKVFGGEIANDMMRLDGVVSRKKQIIPQLTEALTK